MALITDPDQLNQATEVVFDTGAKTIQLAVAGNLSNDGVTLKALYSFTKEEWKDDANLIKFEFPFVPVTDESYELVDGWNFADDTSRYLIRTGGWTVRDTSGNVTEKWAGIVGLGDIESDDQLYYENGNGATDFELTGQVNQAVQIIDDPNGDGNYADGFDRSSAFTVFVREQGQIFGQSALADIGVTTMDSIVYRFPISTGTDTNISVVDTGIDADSNDIADVAPYSGMSITYYGTAQQRDIGGTDYDFSVIIDGNSGTKQQIYEFVQWSLRRTGDIDAGAGTVDGKTADELLEFVGNTLKTVRQSDGGGVFIDNYAAADVNDLVFVDDTGTERTFPFIATLTLQFNANLQSDSSSVYRVFFTDLPGVADYGASGAILVDNDAGVDMSGLVSGASSVALTFDYDGNTQGGRTAGTDADVTVVAIGTDGAQYVRATGTIQRSTANVISLVAPLERNYDNP